VQVGEVRAIARPRDLTLAIALAEVAGTSRDWYGLGRTIPGPMQLIVVRGGARLDSVMHGRGPSWGAGFAIPRGRVIVIRADAGDPHQILSHELAHLALYDAVRVRVPLWFDEGYASIASGEWNRVAALGLNLGVARGKLPGFYELDRALRGNQLTAETAYGLAASAVAMLARRHPDRSLAPLLARLRRGEGFSEAVLASTGWPLGRFELEWQKDVRQRFGLLTWGLAAGFWLAIAVLVFWAAWAKRRRELPRREALNEGWVVEPEEEESLPLDEAGPAP
jgi:hypothetical protein